MSGRGKISDANAFDEKGLNPAAPVAIRIASGAIGGLLRAVYATVKKNSLQPEICERINSSPGAKIIGAFWHRHVAVAPSFSREMDWTCLVSRSRDGEFLARTMVSLGGSCVRGSSRSAAGIDKGGSSAIREMARQLESGKQVLFTPDGPTGPAGKVKPGVIYFASLTGAPIYPAGFAASRSACLPTWDETEIPYPFSRLVISYGEPMEVPRSLNAESLETHRAELERRLLAEDERARASIRPAEAL